MNNLKSLNNTRPKSEHKQLLVSSETKTRLFTFDSIIKYLQLNQTSSKQQFLG